MRAPRLRLLHQKGSRAASSPRVLREKVKHLRLQESPTPTLKHH